MRPIVRMPWTAELKQRALDLWKDHTAKEIVKIFAQEGLSFTRNSIIGTVRRAGLGAADKIVLHPKANNLGKNVEKRSPRPRQKPALRVVSGGRGDCVKVFKTVVQDMPKLREVEVTPRNISLLDLGPGDCRYIAGDDYLYCGHPVREGSSYCPQHHALVWVAPEKRFGAKPKFMQAAE